MMKRIWALILSLILVALCGCTQYSGIDGSTPAYASFGFPDPQTDPPTDPSTDPSTSPTTANPTTEATVPTTVPVDENIEFFTKLFDPFDRDHPYGKNHYNKAMCCEFSRPEELTLDDINWDVVKIRYWDETGYYYTASSNELNCSDFVINAVEELENGIFKIHYTTLYDGDFVITLQSREPEGGEGFRILSNLPA